MHPTNVDALSLDPPHVTVDNLRDYFEYDSLFTDYFNAFLSLPIFPIAYNFCLRQGLFRVNVDASADNPKKTGSPRSRQSKRPTSRMSAKKHSFQPIPLLPMNIDMKSHQEHIGKHDMSNQVLNKRKGLHWIQNERLPLFLESRLYAEYRLAKILSQARLIRHDRTSVPDLYLEFNSLEPPPRVVVSPVSEDTSRTPSDCMSEKIHFSYGETSMTEIDAWRATLQDQLLKAEKDNDLADVSEIASSEDQISHSSLSLSPSPCIMLANMDMIKPEIGPAAYVGRKPRPGSALEVKGKKNDEAPLHVNNLLELSRILIATVVKNAIAEVNELSEEEVEANIVFHEMFPFFRKIQTKVNLETFQKKVFFDQEIDKTDDNIVPVDFYGLEKIPSEETSLVLSVDDQTNQDQENFESDTSKQFSTDASIRQFQALIKDTACEKNWYLWIDLEKFRLSKSDAGKEISILAIKNRYYNTTSHFELPSDLKNDLEISTWKSFTNEKILEIQRKILDPFFKYWVPLYLLKKQIQADPNKYASYFTLKKLHPYSSKDYVPELDHDVSIFVLKSSGSEDKLQTSVKKKETSPHDMFPLPPTDPNIGMRRTYLISTLQHDSIAKHYNWKKVHQKRNSIPELKMSNEKRKSSALIFRKSLHRNSTDSLRPFFTSQSCSITPYTAETMWPNSHIKIELVSPNSDSRKLPLPKELSCSKLLRSTHSIHAAVPATSTVERDYEKEKEKKEQFKLLSSLFNALKCERASGDIFGVYLRERNLQDPTNCLMLWNAISKFLCLFYDQPLIWPKVLRQVKIIHSDFLSSSGRMNVNCSPELTYEIRRKLNEPTGDMFKYIAEHILSVLIPPWKQFLVEEKSKSVDIKDD